MNKLLDWRKIVFYILPPLLALIVLMKVNFRTDLSAFIVAGDNAEEILLASEMQSGTLSRRYLLSVGTDEGSVVPRDFMESFRVHLKQIDGVVDAWSPEQQNDSMKAIEALYSGYGSVFYSLNAEQTLNELFTDQGLARRAEFLKKALLSPQGALIKKMALQDPLLLGLTGFRAIGEQLQRTEKHDTKYKNLILETSMAGFDVAQQGRIQEEIKLAFDRLNQPIQNQMRLDMTGVPIFAVATQRLIQGDIIRIGIVSTVGQIILFLLIFRSISSLFQVFTLL
ncbi:MAG TPA: hypothetical protein VLS45_00250, partial [Methylomicrobium sp.]|nr:hypothetical protein [Methylomicrobium sp.]